MADPVISAGYCSTEELMGADVADRNQPYEALAKGRPGWARMISKTLGGKAPPTEVVIKKALPFKEVDIYAATTANKMFCCISELLSLRRKATNLFSAALREGRKDCPPYAPFLPRSSQRRPELHKTPPTSP